MSTRSPARRKFRLFLCDGEVAETAKVDGQPPKLITDGME
jgi:hypothetical protein